MVSVLEREMYTEAEAARLLRVPQSTLHYWLEGGTRRRKTYKPIIRVDSRGVRTVTWAEFVESGWLREYRSASVPMLELRRFIDEMRDRFGVPWPLADRRPLLSGRKLVYEAQTAAGLDPEFYLVTPAGDQMLLTEPGGAFFRRMEFDGDQASGYRPDADLDSPARESHLAFRAADRAAVLAFFQTAVALGAEVLHEPRVWPEYHESYFGAFIRDPDGNNVEAVCHLPE